MIDQYGPAPTADEILDALDPEQRRVAKSVDGAVCVLAGAGTGKTRAITHRIAYGALTGVMQPTQTLAVTFTARAAGEMRGRLRQLGVSGVQARTFHSAALRQLQFFWPRTYGADAPRLAESKIALVAEAAHHCRLRADRTELRDLTSEIEWAKATQTAPDDYPAQVTSTGRKPPRDAAEVARVYAAYEKVKAGRGQMDFEDVLLLTVGLLDERIEVREQVQAQYRHFTVDEYQDVNPLQQRLLDLWSGSARSLCVVGDASQTIYSFTGATPAFLLGFRHRHRDAEVVELVRDYRSTPQVVNLANRLLTHATGEAAKHRLELVSQRDAGPEPEFTEYPDEPAEAEGVARRVKALLAKGVRAAEIAVLFRTNSQSESYEQALADLGVPYVLRGAERFFERPEVRQAAVLLRGAARSAGDGSGGGLAAEVGAVLASGGWAPEPPTGSGQVRERWESLAALVRLAEDFAAGRPGATLQDFVDELAERANAQHAPTVEGVTLASLHAAKGLEWDAVFLVGLTEGMMPITYADTDEKVEEERRLLYVGITRAREHLALSWALARSPGGRSGRRPSRFLDGLRGAGSSRSDRTPRGRSGVPGEPREKRTKSGPVRCRVCGRGLTEAAERKLGRCLDCPSNLDEALFERLRDWRVDRAKELGQPAYCVFTDATLTAIAEAQPTSVNQLAGISGVGRAKLDKYGAAVLALVAGREPEDGTEPPEPDDDLFAAPDEPSADEVPPPPPGDDLWELEAP
ncbi:ATP-dependent DNA helicase UvrD2 [Yinghuangia seranimata]|uniref:ATP-dependent DNA helicase UvrD2 n=1 Tax=Yinghuangia seranimata TaxID=408067 RepID=UPI00248D1952|nr:ATP-dependent DNA helicase UvrD2 [Yinghuangia seranimata]MDI2131033.1 ATP-dependent DNA helicase UvrD2 [Yinghuangia seranimata]